MPTRKKGPTNRPSDCFSEAMNGVTPVRTNDVIDYEPEPLPGGNLPRREPSNLSEETCDLPLHNIPRQITSEQTCSHQGDIAPKVWGKFKKGELAPEVTIDLHQFRVHQAASIFSSAIQEAHDSGVRCLLIIHGKGSQQNPTPMIKNAIYHWIKSFKEIQGYCSAPGKLGGAGAMLIYIRRKRE